MRRGMARLQVASTALLALAGLALGQAESLVGSVIAQRTPEGAEPGVIGQDSLLSKLTLETGEAIELRGTVGLTVLYDSVGLSLHFSDSAVATVQEPGDALLQVTLTSGTVVVTQGRPSAGLTAARSALPVVVESPTGYLVIAPGGALAVARANADGSTVFSLAAGSAQVGVGPVPATGLASATGLAKLSPGGQSEASFSAQAEQATLRAAPLAELLALAQSAKAGSLVGSATVQMASVTDRLAGTGLLALPPTQPIREARFPEAPVRDVIPAATIVAVGVAPPPTFGSGAAASAARSISSQLLSSGSAASRLVGLRLERTRIVGEPGGVSGGGRIVANQELSLPFTLIGGSR